MTTQESDRQGAAGATSMPQKPAVVEPGTPQPKVASAPQKQQQAGEWLKQPGGQQQQQSMAPPQGEFGEGNYNATREYDEGVKRHLATHDVEQEARDAAPRSTEEALDMQRAENEGRSRTRGEDKGAGNDIDNEVDNA